MEIIIPDREEMMKKLIENPYKYAAVYARESNPNAPNPIETQKYICREYALKNNLLIYKEYSELISASQVSYQNRRKFMELLDDASKGYFKKIIVTRRDRLTRNFDEFIHLKRIFEKLDVEVVYSNDIDIKDTKDYASNFIENIMMALAEMEPKRIKARADAGRNAKKQKGIYDRKAPYGLVYEKDKEHYNKDGIKAKIVEDIFNIFLASNDYIESHEIIEKLKEKAGLEDNEYLKLINDLNKTKVTNILSTPTYAGLQTAHTNYKYKKFYIDHNGELQKVSEEYLSKFTNIDTVIRSKQWYQVVDKWFANNTISRTIVKTSRREKIIFKDLLKCTKCNETLKFTKGKFTCKTDGCIKIGRDVLMKKLIKGIMDTFVITNKQKGNAIKKVTKSLEIDIKNKEQGLFKLIKDQNLLVEKYLDNISNDIFKNEIIKNQKKEEEIRDDIEELKKKIHFLENEFEKVIIPLAKSGYIHMILEDLVKNQSALLEMYVVSDIKELNINGYNVSIIKKI